MPIYEYECKKCHHRFEKIRKFSDPAIKKCPQCGGPVEQLLHAPAVQFKGTRRNETDYAKKSHAATDRDSASNNETKPKAETKSESKAESKKAEKK